MLQPSTRNSPLYRKNQIKMKSSSSNSSILEGDTGPLATHAHHTMTTFLALATPIVLLTPDSCTQGTIDKIFSMALAVNISAHNWVGLNYVLADYVPKVSKALLPPARMVCAGVSLVTFLGLSKISLFSDGGIKGVLKGLWGAKAKAVEEEKK